MIFPSVVRSGVTPSRPCAPWYPMRNEMTSSKTSRAPDVASQLAEEGEEAGGRGHDAACAQHRLDDDGRQVAEVRLERRQRPFAVVERRDDDRVGDRGRDAPSARRAEDVAGNARRVVVRAVVAACEDADLLPAGERARRTQREHRRLRAGVREANELDARQPLP